MCVYCEALSTNYATFSETTGKVNYIVRISFFGGSQININFISGENLHEDGGGFIVAPVPFLHSLKVTKSYKSAHYMRRKTFILTYRRQ